MNYEEKFKIALGLESAGITTSDLQNMQRAIYLNDQDLINSEFAWMHETLEVLGITQFNLKYIIRWIDSF